MNRSLLTAVTVLYSTAASAAAPTIQEILDSNEAYRQALGTVSYEVESRTRLYDAGGAETGCNVRHGVVVAQGFSYRSTMTLADCADSVGVVGPVEVAAGPTAVIVRRGPKAPVDVFPVNSHESGGSLSELQASLGIFTTDVHTIGFRLPSVGRMLPFESSSRTLAEDLRAMVSPQGGWVAQVQSTGPTDCSVDLRHRDGRSTELRFHLYGPYWLPVALEARDPEGAPRWSQVSEFEELLPGESGGIPVLRTVRYTARRPGPTPGSGWLVSWELTADVTSARTSPELPPDLFEATSLLHDDETESVIRTRSGRDVATQTD